jgi:hypothetical protein
MIRISGETKVSVGFGCRTVASAMASLYFLCD